MQDEFEKIFMEGHNARLSRQSFVFRHPISGEVKEGLGEIPLPWGEYPQGVEPNSEMGDAYDLNRGLFRPLPDSLFKPEALTEIQKKPEGSQLDDPYWATASKILHDYLKPDQEAEMTSDDYANYGVRFISSFENNIGAMAVNTVKLSGAPTPVHKAMYYLLETGDRDGITASGFGRAALNMATDPFNWLGLATFGIGTAGKMAGQKLSKMAFKDLLKEIVISKPTKASVALGAEGAVFAAADDLARQNVAVAADVQDAIDPTEAAISGVTGAVLGERLGAGGGAAIESVARGLRNYAAGAPARVAERQSGTTLASGVDPTAMIDDIITAQARYFETGKFEPPTAENPVSVVKPTEQEPGIIAFHGSGADFDEFRLEMIGTGEGAQAYGYGLYFTDSEDIAKFYRDTISRRGGIPQSLPDNPENVAENLALDINFNKGALNDTKELQINSSDPDYDFYIQTLDDNAIETTQSGALKTFEFSDGSIISLLDETVPVFNGKPLNSVYTSDVQDAFGAEIADIAQRAKDMGIPGTLEELTDDVTTVLSQLGQGLSSKRDMSMAVESLAPSGQGAPSRFKTIYNQFIEPKSIIEIASTVTELGDKKGKMYKVGLAPKPDELLDYDLPLSQQPRPVQKQIENLVGDLLAGEPEAYDRFDYKALAAIKGESPTEGYSPTGDDILTDLQRFLETAPNQTRRAAMDASQLLNDFGIPGIKYRAAGSRGAATTDEAAERNYVIFDDKAVKILEKYGIVGPVAVTAGAASQTDTEANDGNT